MRTLLDRFDLTDPTEGQAAGEFTEPLFDTLYRDLTAQGQISEVEALKVGAVIEELDIVDLETRLTQTDDPAIVAVFENETWTYGSISETSSRSSPCGQFLASV